MAIIKNFNRALENVEGSTDADTSANESDLNEQEEAKVDKTKGQDTSSQIREKSDKEM